MDLCCTDQPYSAAACYKALLIPALYGSNFIQTQIHKESVKIKNPCGMIQHKEEALLHMTSVRWLRDYWFIRESPVGKNTVSHGDMHMGRSATVLRRVHGPLLLDHSL